MATEEWITHDGGPMPVGPEAIVRVRFRPLHPRDPRDTSTTSARAAFFLIGTDWWRHQSPNRTNDILSYQVIKPA